MNNKHKNLILVIVIAILIAASGLLLYRSFSSTPVDFVQTTVSNEDIVIRNQIDRLDVRIKKAISKVEEGGALDELLSSPQYQALSTSAVRPIIIGNTGRTNPFLPVIREAPINN